MPNHHLLLLPSSGYAHLQSNQVNRSAWSICCALLVFCACALFSSFSHATEKHPVAVDIGIFLNSIPSVALKDRKFQADFNVWFRWADDSLNPLESFGVVDGQIDLKEELVKKKIGDANYGLYRVVATIHNNFDLSKYPLDDHLLKIQIEDGRFDNNQMVYRADTTYSGASDRVHVPGWDVGHLNTLVEAASYPTNFGDLSTSNTKASIYSRFTYSVDLHRNGYGNFFKLFSMLFFAGLLSFFAFRVRSDYLDSRLALIVSGIFMAAITANMISSALPETDSLDMAEKLYFATMGFILVTCLASLFTFKAHLSGQEEQARLLSRRLGATLPIAYVLVNILIVVLSHNEI